MSNISKNLELNPKEGNPEQGKGAVPKAGNRPKVKANPNKLRQHLVSYTGTDAELANLIAPNGVEDEWFHLATPDLVIDAIRNMSYLDRESVVGFFSRNEVIRETRVQRVLNREPIGGPGKGLAEGKRRDQKVRSEPPAEKAKPELGSHFGNSIKNDLLTSIKLANKGIDNLQKGMITILNNVVDENDKTVVAEYAKAKGDHANACKAARAAKTPIPKFDSSIYFSKLSEVTRIQIYDAIDQIAKANQLLGQLKDQLSQLEKVDPLA